MHTAVFGTYNHVRLRQCYNSNIAAVHEIIMRAPPLRDDIVVYKVSTAYNAALEQLVRGIFELDQKLWHATRGQAQAM